MARAIKQKPRPKPGLSFHWEGSQIRRSRTNQVFNSSGFAGGRCGVTFLRLKLGEKLAFRSIIARNVDEH